MRALSPNKFWVINIGAPLWATFNTKEIKVRQLEPPLSVVPQIPILS